MFFFMLRRIGAGLVLIVVVTALTFFLTYLADIPVAHNILGANASPEQIAALNAQLGLDRSVFEQYFAWAANALQGNLGASYFTGQPVTEAMAGRLPVTLSVVVVSLLITLVFSAVLGIVGAVRRGVVDIVLQGISTIAYVFPAIVLGVVLVYVFAIQLHWVPAIGFVSLAESPSGWLASIITPAIVLAIGGIASLAAQLRGSLIDELGKDYVRTLRSRGSSETSILLKHALRNAASPALTTFSLQFIGIFGASLFIEKIFALPGFGSYGFLATTQGDLPAMLGVTLFSVVLVVIVNLIVDIANGWINPKVRVA